MANSVQKVIEIIFQGTDEVTGTIGQVGSAFSKLEDGLQTVLNPLAKVADGVLKTDAVLTALAVGGLALAFKKSADFEGAMIELQKVIGDDNPQAMEKAKAAAFDLSSQYGETAESVLLSTANFKQAGFDIEEALTLTKVSMDLVIAGGLEASESSSLLISTLKGFKAPATEAARLVDILNEVSNNYATNVQELAIGMAALSPVANLMGFSFEESAGLLTPIIEIFRSGSEASNALKVGLLQLINDTKPVADGLAALGVAQKTANGQLRSGKDILADVSKAFLTVDEDQKLYFAAQLVGIRQAARMVEVFDGVAKSAEITAVALGAAGSAAKEVAFRLASAEVAVKKFTVGFENLAIAVGDKFRSAGVEAIRGATDIENALRELVKDDTFDPLFTVLRRFSSDLGKFLHEVSVSLPAAFELVDFDPLLNAIKDLSGEFGEFFEGLDLTKPEDLAKAIQFVVDGIASLITVTSGMVEGFRPFFNSILAAVEGFNSLDEGSKKSAGNVLALAKVIISAGPKIAAVLFVLGENAGAFAAIFNATFGGVKIVVNALQVAFDSLVGIVLIGVLGINKASQLISFGDADKRLKEDAQKIRDLLKAVGEDSAKQFGEMVDGAKQVGQAFSSTADETDNLGRAVNALPKEKEVEITLADFDVTKLETYQESLAKDIDPLVIPVKIEPDSRNFIEIDGIKTALTSIESPVIKPEVEPIAEDDLDRLKIQAGIIEKTLEFSARLDIAQLEADANIATAMFDAIGVSFAAVSDSVSSALSIFAFDGGGDFSKTLKLRDALDIQLRIQSELAASQVGLNAAQAKYLLARAESLATGQALINISADGLEPEIEAFMWKILERIQIRATADQAEFLLGI